eukprot:TRINITY_DN8104_c0_g1_i2.p1 TRINITY_DN8104_c0_g1~~TRINITY_DN8104_c0_g1_i2.p1  ORF type:complete len:136 (-),score=29.49 TRINITY_DN8104_c0_g1_i2:142-549(-)
MPEHLKKLTFFKKTQPAHYPSINQFQDLLDRIKLDTPQEETVIKKLVLYYNKFDPKLLKTSPKLTSINTLTHKTIYHPTTYQRTIINSEKILLSHPLLSLSYTESLQIPPLDSVLSLKITPSGDEGVPGYLHHVL